MSVSAHAASFDPTELRALNGLDFRARYLVEGYLTGLHRSPFHGSSVEFSEYRDYHPGDDLRQLDWRLYGRSDRLYIKRFEQEVEARCFLVCDHSASMGYQGSRAWTSKAGCARTIAAAMSWLLLKQKDPVGLLSFGTNERKERALRYMQPSHKPDQLAQLLAALNSLPVQGTGQLAELLQHTVRLLRRRSVVLIFSDLLDPSSELERALKHLRFRGHEIVVFQTLDADELDFPFDESGVFLDPETGVRRQVQPSRARRDYLARFAAFMQEHYALFQKLEISHQIFRTDENPGPALAQFLSSPTRR